MIVSIMDKSGQYSSFQYVFGVIGDKLLVLRLHGRFDTGIICQNYQNVATKVNPCLLIPIVVRVRKVC